VGDGVGGGGGGGWGVGRRGGLRSAASCAGPRGSLGADNVWRSPGGAAGSLSPRRSRQAGSLSTNFGESRSSQMLVQLALQFSALLA
jgi:hypothetical protein